MLSPRQEAELIVEELFNDFGTGGYTDRDVPWVDGRESIQEMKTDDFPGWREVEWAGFHAKYLIQKICQQNLNGKVSPYDSGKRHFVKGQYLWDARLNNVESNDVILGDREEYDEIILENTGIGVLVLDSWVEVDRSGDFRRWHEEFKGGSSEYSIQREREGRREQPRKTAYMIVRVFGYFFRPGDLRKGVEEGWAHNTFQGTMRNYDGNPRKTKYQIRKNLVPNQNLLFVKNFNEDPEEFKEDFPDYV